ncbi:MAG: Smr/MutS family protein, partial [Clostridia bacterium]
TVTLKTIGLFALMTQAGIEIPCDIGSSMPIFDEVLPDIGDEQSIEQSLSTFSAHMVNIVGIIEKATSRSLCLFDELGAGTDPTEGAALAIAILEQIKKRGAVVAATTHYAEIKAYALENKGVINASCEFDVETLRPTYRLITGLPGKSNAFAISLRLGIPEEIIERAKAVMSDENVKFEDILTRLEDTESRLSKERVYAQKMKSEAEKALAEAENIKKTAAAQAEKSIAKANEQANRVILSAKASSDFIFNELSEMRRKAEKEKSFSDMELTRKAINQKIKETNLVQDDEIDDNYVPPRPFKVGDDIIISGINKAGYIVSIDEKSAVVQAGIIKTKIGLSDLRLAESKKAAPKKSTATFARSGEITKQEIDVRGQTGDDAYFIIDRYFESAIMAHYETVTIIHGKGTGALRTAVWQQLKSDKRVRSFRSGRYGEGDTGVTVVELK